MPLGAFRQSLNLAGAVAAPPFSENFGLSNVLNNPTAFGTGQNDRYGFVVDVSDSYAIVGAYLEDDASGLESGKAYIYSTSTGSLLYTLNNPNPVGTSDNDNFGFRVAISDNYAIVSAWKEDTDSGKAYIYSTSTGSLLYTLNNPNPFGTTAQDLFGNSVGISNNYAIVGAVNEDDAGGLSSGKAYIYSTSTGSLLYTLNNPNPFGTSSTDQFAISVGISDNYAIVGANFEDETSNNNSGKAYIYSTSTGSLLYTLDNPNAYSTAAGDDFGRAVDISDNYAIVAAPLEDDDSGSNSGKAYIYSTSTGSLLYTLNNPNPFGTSESDFFGLESVAISNNFAIVGAQGEDDASGLSVGKAYIYSTSTGSLLYTLDNPNAYGTTVNDQFAGSVGISNNSAIVGSYSERDASGQQSGKAYLYSTDVSKHIANPTATGLILFTSVQSTSNIITIPSTCQVGDIALLFDTSTTVTDVIPSTWNSITKATTTGIRTNISYKIVTSGDIGLLITGMGGTTRKIMTIFRNIGFSSPTISTSSENAQATALAPNNQTISAGSNKVIYFAAYAKTTATTPTRGFTQGGDTFIQELSNVLTQGIYVKYNIFDTGVNAKSHASATISMTDAGTNTLQSFRMNIS